MAQVATSTAKRPEPKLPKLDLQAVFALHQANLAAVQEAQAVLGEVRAAAETSFATAKQSLELGLAAQRRVAELAAARVCANLERLTTRAT